jgi:hypothetical protein
LPTRIASWRQTKLLKILLVGFPVREKLPRPPG